MRIAYLSNSMIPSRTANSIHVMKMCQAFAALGHDVILTARAGPDSGGTDYDAYGVAANFRIIKSKMRFQGTLGNLGHAWQSTRRVQEVFAPDVYYGRHLLSVWAAARKRLPVVYESHAFHAPALRLVEDRLFCQPGFVRLVVISDSLRRAYVDAFARLDAGKVIVAHDAADLDSVTDRAPLEFEGNSAGRLQVGYVGHLYPGKGMEIISQLAPLMPQVDFHVVGGTDADIAEWKGRLASSPHVHFHGFVPPAETARYRAAMDVLLAPYQRSVMVAGGNRIDVGRWMSPLKIFEAMAAGKAIVASDLPVLREVLEDREEALLVPPDDVSAWQRALQELQDERLRSRLGNQARAALAERHTWRQRAQNVLDNLKLTNEQPIRCRGYATTGEPTGQPCV